MLICCHAGILLSQSYKARAFVHGANGGQKVVVLGKKLVNKAAAYNAHFVVITHVLDDILVPASSVSSFVLQVVLTVSAENS